MAKRKHYRTDLRLTGKITQIADSQKVFGALIHRFAEIYSSLEASSLVAQVKNGELRLALSNLLPSDYFPVPHAHLMDRMAEINGDSKRLYKLLKERVYVKAEQLVKLMSDPSAVEGIYPYVFTSSTQQIHAAIDSKRFNLPGLDPNLYSVPEIIVNECFKEKGKETNKEMYDFSFYMAIDEGNEQEKLLKLLMQAKEQGRPFILGPRGSQGMNTFVVMQVKEEGTYVSVEEPGECLNLGMLIPNQIDYAKSSLKLFTSERRPYNPQEGWDEKLHTKQFISFIEAGSLVYAVTGADVGRTIESPFYTRDVVFGHSYLMPVSRLGAAKG